MSTVLVLPLIPRPQTFQVTLGATRLRCRVTWCPDGPCWLLDLADDLGNPLATGLPLVTGADLLAQLRYLLVGPGVGLYVYTDHDFDADPTFDNLGVTSHLAAVVP